MSLPVTKTIFPFFGTRRYVEPGIPGSPFIGSYLSRSSIHFVLATLNIKKFPDALYKKLQAKAKRNRRSVAQEVTCLLSETLEASKPLSILELQGLGKGNPQGVDATAHVKRERDSWP